MDDSPQEIDRSETGRDARGSRGRAESENNAHEGAELNPGDYTDPTLWSTGKWSAEELVKVASGAIKILDRAIEPKHYNSANESMFAVAKTVGPVIIGEGLRDKKEKRFHSAMEYLAKEWKTVPEMGFACIPSHDKAEEGDNDWFFVYANRTDELSPEFMPTGPGVPYYVFCMWDWDKKSDVHDWKGFQHCNHMFQVTIDTRTGEIHPCKIRKNQHVEIRAHGRCVNHYNRREWAYPRVIKKNPDSMPLRTELQWLTSIALCSYVNADAHWRLTVVQETPERKRYPLRMHFLIDSAIVKDVFNGRDRVPVSLTDKGKLRPILHWTASHMRNIYEEREEEALSFWRKVWLWLFPDKRKTEKRIAKRVPVRTHLRGADKFYMNGLTCHVGVPGGRDIFGLSDAKLTTFTGAERPEGEVPGQGPFLKGDAAVREMMLLKSEEPPGKVWKPKWYMPRKWRCEA